MRSHFCKRNETSKIPSISVGGCKNFVRRENPFFLDIHPSLGHQISQHMDWSERDRMTSRHFNWGRWTSKILNRRILATKTITNCWWSKNRFCMKSKRQKSAIKTFCGSIFHSNFDPKLCAKTDTDSKLIKLLNDFCRTKKFASSCANRITKTKTWLLQKLQTLNSNFRLSANRALN